MKKILITLLIFKCVLGFSQNSGNSIPEEDSAEQLAGMAMIYLGIGGESSITEAYKLAKEAEVKDPNVPEIYIVFGMIKQHRNDLSGAMTEFNKALRLDDRNALAYLHRGTLKGIRNDYRGAVIDLSKCINIGCEDVYLRLAYFNRGVIALKMGVINEACKDLSKAGELGHTEAYDLITQYCR